MQYAISHANAVPERERVHERERLCVAVREHDAEHVAVAVAERVRVRERVVHGLWVAVPVAFPNALCEQLRVGVSVPVHVAVRDWHTVAERDVVPVAVSVRHRVGHRVVVSVVVRLSHDVRVCD